MNGTCHHERASEILHHHGRSPIPTAPPHIGHAYEALATDAIARFERLDGKDVFFLTGTDEHGLKMKQTAVEEGHHAARARRPQLAALPRHGEALNAANDDFIRTTEPRHYRSSEEIWRRMEKARRHLLEKYAGWYSVRQEAFYGEKRDHGRRRMACGASRWARRSSGRRRRPTSSASPPTRHELLAHYEKHPDFILPPERRNEVVSFVKAGLEDLSVSRTTLDWGIPVPARSGAMRPRTSCTCGSTR